MYRSDSIGAWPAIHAELHPERQALVTGMQRLTYGEMDRRAAQVAGALRDLGVERGDRVAVNLKNRNEFLEVLFGAARLGAILVPLNYRFAAGEIAFVLGDCGAKAVVAQAATYEETAKAASYAEVEQDCPVLTVGRRGDYEQWRDAATGVGPQGADPADPVVILYTSGTTGTPKGVILTNENTITNAHGFIAEWDYRIDDTTLVVNPIFHVVLQIMTLPFLYLGARVELMEDFDPALALTIMQREPVTAMFAIPTAWQMITALPEFADADLSALRFGATGGAAPPLSLLETFDRRGITFAQGFGMTETCAGATTMRPGESVHKLGAVGRPFMHVEAKVIRDDESVCAPGERGELVVRGRNVTPGYWNRSEETAAAFTHDGFLRSGDIAVEDGDGFFSIVDRKKDLIISGGENISSVEVEQVLYRHEAVAEVGVIGVPDEQWGETPRAVVALKPGAQATEQELIDHTRERLAHFKCPRSVVFLDALPKTATGKIRKAELRGSEAAEPRV